MINLADEPIPERTRLAGRNGDIWREYCRGATVEALAEKHRITHGRVSQIIKQVRDSVPQETRNDVVREMVDWLRETRREIMDLWDRDGAPVTAGKDGDVVYDPVHGTVVRDHTGRLNAAKVALAFAEREAKLLGADAPAKLDLNTGEDEATRKLAQDSAAYLEQSEQEEQA